MQFPQKSLDIARDIAAKYRLRKSTNIGRARMLYNGAFMHFVYGFDESLKKGKPALYLHEVRSMCDCDSMAGILYLIARELKLKPQIYSAYGMRQAVIGEPVDKATISSHTFITVQMADKTVIVDPQYETFGKIHIKDDAITIENSAKKFSDPEKRTFSSLQKLTEQEFLERFENTRMKGGRESLSVGRAVESYGNRVHLDLSADTLTTFMIMGSPFYILTDNQSDTRVISLSGKVSDDGTWDSTNGTINLFYATASAWKISDFPEPHGKISLPVGTAEKYIAHLEQIAKNSGRKTPLYRLYSNDLVRYFEERGISSTGTITKDVGVNVSAHNAILDSIAKGISIDSRSSEILGQRASYIANKLSAKSIDNPSGLLYSDLERRTIEREFLENIRTNLSERSELVYQAILADGGLLPNRKMRKENVLVHTNQETVVSRFKHYLSERRNSRDGYESALDYALFQRQHPSVIPSPEELMTYYMTIMHLDMIRLALEFRSLNLQDMRKGLTNLLRRQQ